MDIILQRALSEDFQGSPQEAMVVASFQARVEKFSRICYQDSLHHLCEMNRKDADAKVSQEIHLLQARLTRNFQKVYTCAQTLCVKKCQVQMSGAQSYSDLHLALLLDLETGSETVHLEHSKDSSEESNDETSQPYQGLTGLRNLGNTCYMNAVLQCLCSISPLVEYFLSGKYVATLHKENGEVATAFAYLMADMWLGEFECVSPEVFRSVISDLCPAFTKKTQQDAQEFLIYVLNELHEALKKPCKRRCYGNTSTSREDRGTSNETSIITQLFEGQLSYDITCLACHTTTDKNEVFTVLSLPIPSESACSLQDCLECFFQQDTLTWNNQIHCSFCGTKQDAAVKANIGKAPKMVIFHLKRFDYQGSYKRKLGTNIFYPLSNLNLSPYVYPLFRQNPKYNLCAVVNHFGYLDGGHYTAFCKHTFTQNWYSFDDAQVSEIPQSSVQSAAAYLLFYSCKAFSVPTKTHKY